MGLWGCIRTQSTVTHPVPKERGPGTGKNPRVWTRRGTWHGGGTKPKKGRDGKGTKDGALRQPSAQAVCASLMGRKGLMPMVPEQGAARSSKEQQGAAKGCRGVGGAEQEEELSM